MRQRLVTTAILVAASQGCSWVAGLGTDKVAADAPDAALPPDAAVVPTSENGGDSGGDASDAGTSQPDAPVPLLITADAFVAGESGLYGIDPNDRSVYQFQPAERTWTQVGAGIQQLVVNANTSYGVSADGGTVLEYSGRPGSWRDIGTNTYSELVAGGSSLFAVARSDDANLWQYQAGTNTWSDAGGPGRQFVVNRLAVYGLALDGSQIWQDIGGHWSPADSKPSGMMFAGGNTLIVTDPGTHDLERYGGTLDAFTKIAGTSLSVVIDTQDVVYRLAAGGAISKITVAAGEVNIGTLPAAERLYVAGTALYAFDSEQRALIAYDGDPGMWTPVALPR